MRAAAAPETSAPALPPLFRHHVRRPRLTRLLDASKSRLILLTAPAGYGKTTLAAEWLQGRPAEEVAWYYAGPESADVAALSVGIAEAVSHILPAGDRVRTRLRVPQVPDNNAEILAELLAADLVKWPETAWLVIDDYHHAMESESAERFVEELLRQAPIRVLITTRRRPSWVTARHVVYGEVFELTLEQLSMTATETSAALNPRGTTVSKSLVDGAGGWPALIGLASRAPEASMQRQALSDTQFRFLVEEVVAGLPELQRRVALEASVLPLLSEELLADCLEMPVARSDLEVLRDAGILRVSGTGWIMHPLLRKCLLTELRRDYLDTARVIKQRAVEHLTERGKWSAAFTVAIESGDVATAVTIVVAGAPTLFSQGRVATVESWLSELRREKHRHAALELVRAEVLFRQSRFAEAAAVATSVLATLPPDAEQRPRALALVGETHHLRSNSGKALEYHRQALQAATSEEDVRRAAWGALTAAHQLPDVDCREELRAFKAVVGSDLSAHLRATVAECLVREKSGTYLGCEELVVPVLRVCREVDNPMAVSGAFAAAAYYSLMKAEYRKCQAVLADATTYCRGFHLSFARGMLMTYEVAARIGLRQFGAARALLLHLQGEAHESEDALFRLEHARLAWQLGLVSGRTSVGASPAVSHLRPSPEAAPDHAVTDWLAAHAFALAASGHVDDAAAQLDVLSEHGSTPIARCYMALANALLNEENDDAFAEAVHGAIALARGIACLDPLVTGYRLAPRLLTVVAQSPDLSPLLCHVLSNANDSRLARQHELPIPDESSDGVSDLTNREVEVMQLMYEGLSNREIAERLVISLSTVKVHVHHIFEKLGVRNRVQASARWRTMTGD